mmetsp:Transcript_19296/g.34408  ORF Transcript_19296/g.34408 Transcript_19296/m.34408 type:complete len:239 (-) Transcript_19296:494-1210(-)
MRRPFTLQLEHYHTTVVASRQKVHLRVGAQDPKPVMLPAEGLHSGALRHVPHPNTLVLRVGHNNVLTGVEHHAGDVVDMPAQGVHLPGLSVIHAPELDLPVIRAGHNEREAGVKRRPINTTVVPLQYVFHHRVAATEEVRVHLLRQAEHVITARGCHSLLPEATNVPNTNRLVQGGRHNQVLLHVEVSTHDVMVVPRQHCDAGAGLPVPDADGLIIAPAHDPGVFLVELDRPDVVQVA